MFTPFGNRSLVLCLALLLAPRGLRAAEEPTRVTPEPLPAGETSITWSAPQFLQADKEGRVFVLRSDTLEVFQIAAGDKLVSRGPLEAVGSAGSGDQPILRQAVMSTAGDVWLLLDSSHSVRLFRGGKEKPLPQTDWIVSAVTAPSGNPVLAVEPAQADHGHDATAATDPHHPPAKPPFLLSLGDTDWDTLVQGDYFRLGNSRASIGQEMRAGAAVWLTSDTAGSIWVAHRNAYRLQHYSPLGKLKDEIVVGDGKVQWASRTADDRNRLETIAKENKLPFRQSGVSPVQETPVVLSMILGRDGRVYLLVESQKGLALDRFDPDPANQSLERVMLSGLQSGRYTMAAGRHALYLATLQGNGGRWSLSWEALDSAKWRKVENAVVNGQPVAMAAAPAR
jgi:hypothetical protein